MPNQQEGSGLESQDLADLDVLIAALFRQFERRTGVGNLGSDGGTRDRRTDDMADLDQAYQKYQDALAGIPADSSEEGRRLLDLCAFLLAARYGRSANLGNLNQIFILYQDSLAQTRIDVRDQVRCLTDLGGVLLARYRRTGAVADLDQALQAYQHAWAQTPPGSPARNHQRWSAEERLLAAIFGDTLPELHTLHQAYQEDQAHHKAVRAYHNLLMVLGEVSWERYRLTGDMADLDRTLQVYQEALARTRPDFYQPRLLMDVGGAFLARYRRTADMVDLDQALQMYQDAREHTHPGSSLRAHCLMNLSEALLERHGGREGFEELDQALQIYQKIYQNELARTPATPSRHDRRLADLGRALLARYRRTGDLADLDRSLMVYQDALADTPSDSSSRTRRLLDIGKVLLVRYRRTGEASELEQSYQVYQNALAGTPQSSPERSGRLYDLGTILLTRFAHVWEKGNWEQAEQAFYEALGRTTPNSPERHALVRNYFSWIRGYYASTGVLTDLEQAIAVLEESWSLLQFTFAALPVAYKLGQQQQWLGIYSQLISAHLERASITRRGALPHRRRALEVAESSKSRLLTELVGRTSLPAPATIPSELALREQALLGELTAIDTLELAAYGQAMTPKKPFERRRQVYQRQDRLRELNYLWDKMIQAGPEAADYVALRRGNPLTWTDLSRLAADAGERTLILSLFMTGTNILCFCLHAGWRSPGPDVLPLDQKEWNDLLARFFPEVHGYDGSNRRGETWDQRLGRLLRKRAGPLWWVERLIVVPEAEGHLLPWSVLFERAGWHAQWGGERAPLAVVTLPALALLPRLRSRPRHLRVPCVPIQNLS